MFVLKKKDISEMKEGKKDITKELTNWITYF